MTRTRSMIKKMITVSMMNEDDDGDHHDDVYDGNIHYPKIWFIGPKHELGLCDASLGRKIMGFFLLFRCFVHCN